MRCTLELSNVTISDNTAGLGGTGDTYGGALFIANDSAFTMKGGTSDGNTANNGGSTFRENTSGYNSITAVTAGNGTLTVMRTPPAKITSTGEIEQRSR